MREQDWSGCRLVGGVVKQSKKMVEVEKRWREEEAREMVNAEDCVMNMICPVRWQPQWRPSRGVQEQATGKGEQPFSAGSSSQLQREGDVSRVQGKVCNEVRYQREN